MSRNTPEQNRRSVTKFRLEKEKRGEHRLLVTMPEALSEWLDSIRQPSGLSRQALVIALLRDYLTTHPPLSPPGHREPMGPPG